jgi:hypothetical protein
MLQQVAHCWLLFAGFEPVSAWCKAVPFHCCGVLTPPQHMPLLTCGSWLHPLGLAPTSSSVELCKALTLVSEKWLQKWLPGPLAVPGAAVHPDPVHGSASVINLGRAEELTCLQTKSCFRKRCYLQARLWMLCHVLHYKVGRQTTTR